MSDSEPVFVTKKSRQVPPAVGTNVCGSNILATVTADNKCYFSPNHVCQALGIAWSRQRVKIMEDAVLSKGVTEMVMPSAGGAQKTTMLPIEFLSGWLFTIKKVAPEVQAKLNLYRAEGFRATYSIRIRSERLSSSMSPHLG